MFHTANSSPRLKLLISQSDGSKVEGGMNAEDVNIIKLGELQIFVTSDTTLNNNEQIFITFDKRVQI